MAKAAEADTAKTGKFKQIGMVVAYVAKRDRKFVPIAATVVLLPILLAVLLLILGSGWFWLIVAVPLSLLGFMIVLNNRSNKSMLGEMEGQPGAGAQLIENMRGDWRVTPAIASTTQYDIVSLVIGRPGIILVGEGNPARVRSLLGQEKRRLAKVIGSAEMRDIIIGRGEGEIPLNKLRITLMKLPRSITGKDVNALSIRLKALTARPQMPKGSIPKSMRPQSGSFRAPRGR